MEMIIVFICIALIALAALWINIAHSEVLRRKLKEAKAENARLRYLLDEKSCELKWAIARTEAGVAHSVRIRDDEIDEMKERHAKELTAMQDRINAEQRRCAKLENMLMQKWREMRDVDIPE